MKNFKTSNIPNHMLLGMCDRISALYRMAFDLIMFIKESPTDITKINSTYECLIAMHSDVKQEYAKIKEDVGSIDEVFLQFTQYEMKNVTDINAMFYAKYQNTCSDLIQELLNQVVQRDIPLSPSMVNEPLNYIHLPTLYEDMPKSLPLEGIDSRARAFFLYLTGEHFHSIDQDHINKENLIVICKYVSNVVFQIGNLMIQNNLRQAYEDTPLIRKIMPSAAFDVHIH